MDNRRRYRDGDGFWFCFGLVSVVGSFMVWYMGG